MWTPAGAARSDDLHDTVDYGTLVDQVRSAVANDPVDLIETLAQRIADVCLRNDQVADVEVTVHKPHAPIQATFEDVALTINRSRRDPENDPLPTRTSSTPTPSPVRCTPSAAR